MRRFALTLLAAGLSACAPAAPTVTDAQKAAIADSAAALIKAAWANFGKLDMNAAFRDYSAAPDARYMDNGVVYPSLGDYKKANEQFATVLEYVRTTGDAWDAMVLGPDAVMITVPWHADMKAKGRSEYKARGVSSVLVQRREGSWQIVHTHESFANANELMAALTPLRKNEAAKP